jgi:Flp pilus assembly protein TadD
MPREWYRALAASGFGDTSTALASFTAARKLIEDVLRTQPDYAIGWSALGLIDANLGHNEEAIREGRHACDLLPLSVDAWRGPTLIQNLAMIYASIGDKDHAIEQLQIAAQVQNGVHYGELRLNPQWDALRSDARFQEIIAPLAPK